MAYWEWMGTSRIVSSRQTDFTSRWLQPSADKRSSLSIVNGLSLRLPLIATYELTDGVGIMAAGFVTASSYSSPSDADSSDERSSLRGQLFGSGGSLSLEFSGETFAVRPGVEFTQYQARR